MISRPPLLGGTELIMWRLDDERHAKTWNSGEGAFRLGGRWNSKGIRAVYCSLDPATAILEVAVHKGFRVLDTVPHVLSSATIPDPSSVHVIMPADTPNLNWLRPGSPGAGQQTFGDELLSKHLFFAIPSAVSSSSWNLVFDPSRAEKHHTPRSQERFALDTRLHPPPSKP